MNKYLVTRSYPILSKLVGNPTWHDKYGGSAENRLLVLVKKTNVVVWKYMHGCSILF